MLSVNQIRKLKTEKDKEFVILHSERVHGKRLSRLAELLSNNEGLFSVRCDGTQYEGDNLDEAVKAYNGLIDELKNK